MNKVQTFNTFNQGCRRPNRKEHLRLCGYKLVGIIDPYHGKPKELAKEKLKTLTAATGKYYHGVYIQDLKSMEGDIGYSLYAKIIE